MCYCALLRRCRFTGLVALSIALVSACAATGGDRITTPPERAQTVTSTTSLPPATTTTSTTTTLPPATTTTSTTTTLPPTTTTAPPSALQRDDEGTEVARMQARLTALGYWLGPVDGIFGIATFHAVVALQKTAGLDPTGVFDAPTAAALDEGTLPEAHSANGRVVEIDRTRQVLLLVRDGSVDWVFDTSTGRRGFTTPEGHFAIYAEIDASNVAGAYRPKYFYEDGRLAIHGYKSVPPYPFSHGCARVIIKAMDWLWAHGDIPVGTSVWVY